MPWGVIFKPLAAILLIGFSAVIGALIANRVPILEQPGIGVRTWSYLTRNNAETTRISAFPELRSRFYDEKPKAVFAAALAAGRSLGWELQTVAGERLSFTAVATTPLLRFKDDVSVAVVEAENGNSEIRMRSFSRVGRGDLGANARRIVEFHQALEQGL